ncbi:MAG: hypothetical protein HC887_07440, partial [Desulfobacteraceae bacterium]|nr:hypothetical protein [Desulfobacteraceae bacterium]
MNLFRLKTFFGKAVLCELGAAILFFGSLVHHPELAAVGRQALQELQSRGYAIPTDADPVRVYPAATSGNFTGTHAGGWRPGVISLRENPQGHLSAEIYFRHELMHEASYRTCSGKLPIWAEEAAAISFSGELSAQPLKEHPTQQEVEYLKNRIRIRALPDTESYKTLSKLVAIYGWSQKPCEVSKEISKLLTIREDTAGSDFSYILISLVSGRIFEFQGDIHAKYPPGSLLKIPYAASLRNMPADDIGRELAESNTEKLLSGKNRFDTDTYHLLISGIRNAGFDTPDKIGDGQYWRQYLGERRADGDYPLEASLDELAKMLRASLLFKPEYFSGLSQNGVVKGSTLYAESGQDKKILK